MKRLIPRTIAGQVIAVVLIAMAASQIALVVVMVGERQSAERGWWADYILARLASVVELLDASPENLYPQILQASSTRRMDYSIREQLPAGGHGADGDDELYASELMAMVSKPRTDVAVLVSPLPSFLEGARQWVVEWFEHDDTSVAWLQASVKLKDGKWLSLEVGRRLHPPPLTIVFIPLLTMLVVFGTMVIIVVRHITQPMKKLARAAQALGRGEDVQPLPMSGPAETRHAIEAFNDMRERLSRFVLDRTRMLAAVGHDLRTPITNLRLRAEFIDDEETRTRILASLDEMHHMAEAALAFAREEANTEPTRMVDLNALVQTVCADQADMDRDVTCADGERLAIRCRPNSMKRALRNLIENAVSYGKLARVRMKRDGGELTIFVEDDGPGIPEGDMVRVFSPFVRLDESRGQAGAGMGLGLAIARSIIRGHGGEITLHNRNGGGLSAVIQLPCQG